MCGRFMYLDIENMRWRFWLDEDESIPVTEPRYNVAPGQNAPVVVEHSPIHIEMMKWGLHPHFVKEKKFKYNLINARAEGIEKNGLFRYSFKNKRCLIPTNGFFEWKRIPDEKRKIPYFIHMKNKELFAFAGLWDEWTDGKETIRSFTIITTEANKVVEPIHDRMPVIFNRDHEKEWLDPDNHDLEKLKKMLKPFPIEQMEAYPISELVNNPRSQSPSILTAVKDS